MTFKLTNPAYPYEETIVKADTPLKAAKAVLGQECYCVSALGLYNARPKHVGGILYHTAQRWVQPVA